MKKLNLLIGILSVLNILSCTSNDNSEQGSSSVVISEWINKNYTFYDSASGFVNNPILKDSILYILNDNKIISYSGLRDMNNTPRSISRIFSYSNNLVSQITSYENDQLVGQINYIYDNSNELAEVNTVQNSVVRSKSIFTQTLDTIHKEDYSSNDGIQFNLIRNSKFVLNIDSNYHYQEYINGNTSDIVDVTYNESNPSTVTIFENNTRTYSYDSSLNSESLATINSFGKKTTALLTSSSHGIYVRGLSTNVVNSIFENSPNSQVNDIEYDIDISTNPNGYSTRTSYTRIVNGIAREQEVSEFIFE